MSLRNSGLESECELALMTSLSPLSEKLADARAGHFGSNDGSHGRTIDTALLQANYLRRN